MKKDQKISSFSFILSSLCSAVGMGAVWAFPMKIDEYSWVFIVPFLFAFVTCGWPLLLLETSLGNWLKKNHIRVFAYFNKRIGFFIGWLQTLVVSVLSTFYIILVSWTLVSAFSFFFINDYKQIEPFLNLSHPSSNKKPCLLFLLPTLGAVLFTSIFLFWVLKKGVAGGIANLSRIFFPFFLLILFGLLLFVIISFGKDYKFEFKLEKLSNFTLWKDAFGQAFFMLSTSTGTIIIYSSHIRKEKTNNNFLRSFWVIIISIIVSFTIAAIINIFLSSSNVNNLAKLSGPTLLFGVILELFLAKFSLPILGFSFFILIFFIGFTSLIGQVESLTNALEKDLKFTRNKTLYFSLNFIGLMTLFYLFFVFIPGFELKIFIKFLSNWVASSWLLLLTFAELLLVFLNRKKFTSFKNWYNKYNFPKMNFFVQILIFCFIPLLSLFFFFLIYEQIISDIKVGGFFYLISIIFTIIIPISFSIYFTKREIASSII